MAIHRGSTRATSPSRRTSRCAWRRRRRSPSPWPRIPGPIPNALDRNIEQLLQEAATLRDQGRIDQALAAYQDIRTKNPKLTSVNLVIGDLYRRKAAQEKDPAARQALLRQALDAYDQLLKTDATNERALAESAAVRAASTRNE